MRLQRLVGLGMACVLTGALATGCAQKLAGPIELTQKDDGSTQTLPVGQALRISLESNPTTGYRWDVDGAVPPQLRQVGEPTYTAGSTAIGAGGTEVWTFEGATVGSGTLTLKYWRSFEPTTPPISTFEVKVNVE